MLLRCNKMYKKPWYTCSQFFELGSGKLTSSLKQNSDSWRSWKRFLSLVYDQVLVMDRGECILNSKSSRMIKDACIDLCTE